MRAYESYFDYERDLGRDVVAAFLAQHRLSLDGKHVLDIGCGEGGVLAGLAERFSFHGFGLDYDEEMVGRAKSVPSCELRHGNFYTYAFRERYDFVLIRDVLEHCGDAEGMLVKAAHLLAPEGCIYVTYTPFLSPFGGHQHNGNGIFSNVPYLQVLPERVFLKLISPGANLYKGGEQLVQDLRQIRTTWLTTGKVKQAARHAGLVVEHAGAYIVRPDYRYKFGLPPIALPSVLPVNSVTDAFCTCVEMLLRPDSSRPIAASN